MLGLIGSIGSSIVNGLFQKNMNDKNASVQQDINAANIAAQKEINQSQLDYARQMTQIQWERDDNAHQREVADLVAAGLSPLANTSGAQVTSAQSYNPQSEAVAQAYQAQAPQLDVNAIVNSLIASKQLAENKRQFDQKMIREDNMLEIRKDELQATMRSLDIKSQEVANQAQKITNDYLVACQNVNLGFNQLKETKDNHSKQLILQREAENAKLINNSLQSAFGKGFNSIPVYDYDEYVKKLDAWGAEWNTFLKSKLSKEGSIAVGNYKSRSGSAGFNFKNMFGEGTGVNGGLSNADAKNASASVNDNYEKALILEFTSHHPYPLYIYEVKK